MAEMIRTERGNIWSYHPSHYIVIPTNVGWRKNGKNVMGRGLARQAAERYPELPRWYGRLCKGHGSIIGIFHNDLIMFPVKPLNESAPHLSWKSKASLKLIEASVEKLAFLKTNYMDDRPVAIPMVGCGNGGLEMSEVRPILDKWLSDERFVLVLEEKGHAAD